MQNKLQLREFVCMFRYNATSSKQPINCFLRNYLYSFIPPEQTRITN